MTNEEDVLARTAFGQAALRKLAPLPQGFRLYKAEWVGDKPSEWKEMRFTGCEFREAESEKRTGELVPVPGTQRTVLVSKAEAQASTD